MVFYYRISYCMVFRLEIIYLKTKINKMFENKSQQMSSKVKGSVGEIRITDNNNIYKENI